ncbi:tetratricopeptide repeat protein [Marivirga tractuosa]|uniref:tetratricopeptide repeat protein n=1 Tax=Marivirga tractuosa TaxID=1006 RepID=UPI0035CF53D8
MKLYLTIIFSFISLLTLAQPNCNYFLHVGDSLKYEACKETENATGHYQFSKEFQIVMDNALEIDSTYSYAYRSKSVAYLKSGDFLEWKRLIDLAVKYDPIGNLGYRASCRHQFFKDYGGAIVDIEELSRMTHEDIGHSANGVYHLEVVRALCYRGLGNNDKAIEIIENQLATDDYLVGIYDYIHLGVLYLEADDLEKAKSNFEKQLEYNDLAENHFYMAKALKAQGKMDEAKIELENTIALYENGYVMHDSYVYADDKIYWSMIEEERRALD